MSKFLDICEQASDSSSCVRRAGRLGSIVLLALATACTFDPQGFTPDGEPGVLPGQLQTSVFQQGVGYGGTRDTYIDGSSQSDNLGNLDRLSLALSVATGSAALVRFEDIFGTEPRQIPPGAMILSAELTLSALDRASGTLAVYEVAVPWSENTTWDTFGTQSGIQTPDRGRLLDAQASAGSNLVIDVTDSVDSWAVAPTKNMGWILEPRSGNVSSMASSEYLDVAQRPKLTVKWML